MLRMPRQSEEMVVVPAVSDSDKMRDYQQRIDRFRERQVAARARTLEAQRRFRIFTVVVIGGLLINAMASGFVAWSLAQLKETVSEQLQAAEAAVTDSNERWKETSQSLAESRNALQANQDMLVRFRAALLLPYVDSYLNRRVAADPSIDRSLVSARLKEVAQPALISQLTQTPDASDAQLKAQIDKLLEARLPAILHQARASR